MGFLRTEGYLKKGRGEVLLLEHIKNIGFLLRRK